MQRLEVSGAVYPYMGR